ncbi:Insect pheromone-binding family, A10/OS-D [Popillia japonica]|uniref:Insect pheromone-binding family, A10/OS-D n=1 Tax=Popillia japonica TaxID=7064 RepID=A0AAW1KNF6_POPJA
MNSFLLVFVLSIAAVALAQDKYTTRFDNVNIDEILNNRRLLKGYANCLLDKGPCSPDGAELKLRLPDAVKSNCEKCSEKQREGSKVILKHLIDKEPEIWKELEQKYGSKVILKHLIDKEPEIWKELEQKYDPDRTYRNRYKDKAAEDDFCRINITCRNVQQIAQITAAVSQLLQNLEATLNQNRKKALLPQTQNFKLRKSVSCACVVAQEGYSTKYDSVNVKNILNNKRLLKNYTNCLLDKGWCNPDGAELKKVLPDVIETGCTKCNEFQSKSARIILRHLIDNEPEIWKGLEEKYDPEGTYRSKYMEQAKEEGINI